MNSELTMIINYITISIKEKYNLSITNYNILTLVISKIINELQIFNYSILYNINIYYITLLLIIILIVIVC